MSGGNYLWCPGCDRKALYVGDIDVPEMPGGTYAVEAWHVLCRRQRFTVTGEAGVFVPDDV